MKKRKLAGALALGTVAAGAVGSSATSAFKPFEYVKDAYSKTSTNIKSWLKGKSAQDISASENYSNSKEKAKRYGSAINIAYRMYCAMKKSNASTDDTKSVINTLKKTCFRSEDHGELSAVLKNIEINKSKNDLDGINIETQKKKFKERLTNYSNTLLKIANEIGIEDEAIKECFTKDIESYKEAKKNDSNIDAVKMRNGTIVDDDDHEVYNFYVFLMAKSLSFFDNLVNEKGGQLIHYISNTADNNETAVLSAVRNLEERIFDLSKDEDNTKASKLIASLIINKFENDSGGNEHDTIINNLLGIQVKGDKEENESFKDSKYIEKLIKEKVENDLYKSLKCNNVTEDGSILTYATDNEYANSILAEKTKDILTRIADNPITRYTVTGLGVYAGLTLASALGLGIVGTTALAVTSAATTNIATDLTFYKNSTGSDKWKFTNIKNRYGAFYKYLPVAAVVGTYNLAKGALSFFGGS